MAAAEIVAAVSALGFHCGTERPLLCLSLLFIPLSLNLALVHSLMALFSILFASLIFFCGLLRIWWLSDFVYLSPRLLLAAAAVSLAENQRVRLGDFDGKEYAD